MTRYSQHTNPAWQTLQSEQADPAQVRNSAGGFVFALDDWGRLDRFLVLGSEGGTYYAGERELTKDNAKVVERCALLDGPRTVARIVEISDQGRAPKNDPAIFALAICAGSVNVHVRQAALAALPKVCRTGTHLFHFVQDVTKFRRWGRGLRTAVASWYLDRSPESLAMQLIKYQQRDGWSHRDLLRLSHPAANVVGPAAPRDKEVKQALFRWVASNKDAAALDAEKVVGKRDSTDQRIYPPVKGELPSLIHGFARLQKATSAKEAAALVREHGLPRECVPTQFLNDPAVWEALLPGMGLTALVRNLGKMTSVGLVKPLSDHAKAVAKRLADPGELRAARVHPMTVLLAMRQYAAGHGEKGKLKWDPVPGVVDALDAAFYAAFKAVEPTGKKHLLALDVSGSMTSPIAGTSLTCREASAAMALVTASVEESWHCVGFTNGSHPSMWTKGYGGYSQSLGSGLTPLSISPRQRLTDVVRAISNMPFGGTDCALPMVYALEKKLEVDVFCIYTDSETWAGNVHPHQALRQYRQRMNRPRAKLVVVGMTSTGFTIADVNDAGMLDVVGFDSATPQILADFARDPVPGKGGAA